ncbi:DUF4097 family beta strand repeat-containing protein [Solwaraspora sp. WMMD1047]|uniref:DUF4097 family beta strand repeat-containing protein n=1 Tax=Solwaraspora sp. WMMD1047 TaxID=3016102 RepID=UPI002415C9D2|nr:DUF4097 family beta strand repeat-containing protein [Solwaraspora sp. WMMD1047]MDG4832700.1 DUF4097 family beta strand repeat-containing protein [Solwaraspora sp. WMMD1047]
MRPHRLARSAGAATAGAVLLVPLAGCDLLAESRLDFSHTEDARITGITINPGSGDVVIRTGTAPGVEINRVVRYRGAEPGATYRIDGTELIIDVDCGRRCGVSYDLVVPPGLSVRGENGSGDVLLAGVADVNVKVGSGSIEITDATGAVTAETGSGDITVSDARAAVTARAGSGSITGHGLGGGEVRAETGSGDITLALTSAASVRARADSGDVELLVPAGDFRVRVETGSGDQRLGVSDVPAATALLDLRTGSGNVTVDRI